MMSSGKSFEALKIGKLRPKPEDVPFLSSGEVGFISGSIKDVRDTRVGDTITSKENPSLEPLLVLRLDKWSSVAFFRAILMIINF